MQVLIVAGSNDIEAATVRTLRRVMTVDLAGDATIAALMCANARYDIVVLAATDGGGEDWQRTCRQLCEVSPGSQILVLCAAPADGADQTTAVSYLSRPFSADDLVDRLQRFSP